MANNPFEAPRSFDDIKRRADATREWEAFAEQKDGEGIEENSARVLGAVELAFKARAEAERQRVDDAVDAEYWCCLVFQSRAQKEEFLTKVGADPGVFGDKYIDGESFANLVNVDLAPCERRYNMQPRLDAKLQELTRDWGEIEGD